MNAESEESLVLVVDDNLDAAEVLALLIEVEGFAAATARTISEARESVVQRRPRLILLDLNLPDGNGMSLLAELKNDLHTSGIEVVMVSGMVDDRVREEAHLLGASAFVTKPMNHAQLVGLLETVR
ncbi:MAG: response regulator [Rubrivivax sp.]|nr:MAG: response regulator [Rubrivivax sp.]